MADVRNVQAKPPEVNKPAGKPAENKSTGYGGQHSTEAMSSAPLKGVGGGSPYGGSSKKSSDSNRTQNTPANAAFGSPTGSNMTPDFGKLSAVNSANATDPLSVYNTPAPSSVSGDADVAAAPGDGLVSDPNDPMVQQNVLNSRRSYAANVDNNGNVNGQAMKERYKAQGLSDIQATLNVRNEIVEGYVDEMVLGARGSAEQLQQAYKARPDGIALNVLRSIGILKNANYNYNDGQLKERLVAPYAQQAQAYFAEKGQNIDLLGGGVGKKDVQTFWAVGKVFEWAQDKNPEALLGMVGQLRESLEGDEAKQVFDYVYGRPTDKDAEGNDAPYSNGYVTNGAYAKDVAATEMGQFQKVSGQIPPVRQNNNNNNNNHETAPDLLLAQQLQMTQYSQMMAMMMQYLGPLLRALGIDPQMVMGPLMQQLDGLSAGQGFGNVGMGSNVLEQSPTGLFRNLLGTSYRNSNQTLGGNAASVNPFATLGGTPSTLF
jgi:hypothetical protein